jgi:threonine/homoserine/homoserine lactone efflux protein
MSVNLILALIVFAFVASITPGPNNLMLLASGVNYGFRRSIPHMLGICIGFMLMIFVVFIPASNIYAPPTCSGLPGKLPMRDLRAETRCAIHP